MKKGILFILSAILLAGCSQAGLEEPRVEDKDLGWQTLYERQKVETGNDLKTVYDEIAGGTRATEANEFSVREFCDCLVNLPSHEIDSLYNIYCSEEMENALDERFEYTVELLEENVPQAEVAKLFGFVKTYSENGGCDVEYVNSQIEGVSPLVKDCMVRAAGAIDLIFGEVSQTRSGGLDYCFHQMMIGLAGGLAEGAVGDEIVLALAPYPGIDMAATLIAAGYDTYEAIKSAHEFDMCCASHW